MLFTVHYKAAITIWFQNGSIGLVMHCVNVTNLMLARTKTVIGPMCITKLLILNYKVFYGEIMQKTVNFNSKSLEFQTNGVIMTAIK